jgi:predicted glycosyl hydrolase (DUF1957 family)
MFGHEWWQQGPQWGQQQQEQAREKRTKVIPLEDLVRQNNQFIVIQNVHDGWMIRWGEPEQYLAVSNRAKLHEAVDVFAGTDPAKREVRASIEPAPIQEYTRQQSVVDEWRDFAAELAACLESCRHGMNGNHPALPMMNTLLSKAARKGIV